MIIKNESRKIPLISVIVPVYNAEKYLKKCMDSIERQNYQNTQIIIVNDGSTDGSEIICRKYLNKNSKFELICTPNRGVSAARNTGLSHANGELIMFVDSDDYIENNYVSTMVEKMVRHEADLAVCGYIAVTCDSAREYTCDNSVLEKKEDICEFVFNSYFKGLFNNIWNKIYRKKLITSHFKDEFLPADDLIFNIDYMKNVNKVVSMDKLLYYYRSAQTTSLSGKIWHNHTETTLKRRNEIKKFFLDCRCSCFNEAKLDYFFYKKAIRFLISTSANNNESIKNRIKNLRRNCKDPYLQKLVDIKFKKPIKQRLLQRMIIRKRAVMVYLIMRGFLLLGRQKY